MNLLLINTALEKSFISLVCDNKEISRIFPFGNTSETLLPEIDKLLKKQKLKLDSLDAVAVCVGPGSFTGIRVGIATAKALAIARFLPLISFNAFDAFAKNKICLTKANSGGAYVCSKGEISFFEKSELEKLKNKTVQIFEEEKNYFASFNKAEKTNLINSNIALVKKLFKQKKFCLSNELIPLYVQKSQAENELILNIKNSVIKQADKNDIACLEEIEKECFSVPYSAKTLEKEIENKNKKLFCLVLKKQIIGYVLYSTLQNEIELERICIIKKYRGLKLGEKLLNETIKTFNVKKCFLEVNKKNEIAINLYSKLGFVKTGERKNYYGDKEDAVLMTKDF